MPDVRGDIEATISARASEIFQQTWLDYINFPNTSTDLYPFTLTQSTENLDDVIHPTYLQITRALDLCNPVVHHAEDIAGFLHTYFTSRFIRITGLRTGIIPTNGLININDDGEWTFLIVEWREGSDTDVAAIFKTGTTEFSCNALFHYGICPWQPHGSHWKRSSYTWYVSDVIQLRALFVVAQHALRLFPAADRHSPNLMQRFFQNEDSPSCSPEE
jgi:hypothetical protein